MALPKYLEENRDRIRNNPPQKIPKWNKQYQHKSFEAFSVMRQLQERFPNRIIQRPDIVELFSKEETLYLGLVGGMVWGSINATRPRIKGGDRTHTNFYRLLNTPEEFARNTITHVSKHLLRGDVITPFLDMKQGKYRINGLGPAYFTKLFFFLGQADDTIYPKPLIFDKWTSNAYYALMVQHDPGRVTKCFSGVNNSHGNSSPGSVKWPTGTKLANLYCCFVNNFNSWAEKIGVSAAALEEFLFGWDLRLRRNENNPRVELWNIVRNGPHCSRSADDRTNRRAFVSINKDSTIDLGSTRNPSGKRCIDCRVQTEQAG